MSDSKPRLVAIAMPAAIPPVKYNLKKRLHEALPPRRGGTRGLITLSLVAETLSKPCKNCKTKCPVTNIVAFHVCSPTASLPSQMICPASTPG